MKELRRFTMARVGLGRTGSAIPLREYLEFQLAHARARDAEHYPLNVTQLSAELATGGWETLALQSQAHDHAEYLRRPDRGRRLDEDSRARIESLRGNFDLAIVLADGL